MKRVILFFLWIVFMPVFSYGQISLIGIVSDAETSEPLAGAHILLENTFIATISSSTGQFRISGLKQGEFQVSVSYIGYEKFLSSLKINKDTTLNISLKPSAIMGSEVIVTATRAPENSPTTFTTITSKEIEQVNLGQDMPYLLQTSPSVVTTSDGGTGIGYSNLRIRGTDLTRINVTINGIPLNDSESHGVWWVDLPDFASSAESVQIQRGVGTSTNGAAAFGASINIRSDDPEVSPYGEASISGGSFKTFKLTCKAGTGLIKKRWALDTRFSLINSAGYIDRASADLFSFSISAGYFGKNSFVRLMVLSGNERTYQAWAGVPGYIIDSNRTFNPLGAYTDYSGYLNYYENQTDNYRQTHYHLNWLQIISKNWNISTALHYTRGIGYYEEIITGIGFTGIKLINVAMVSRAVTSFVPVTRRYLDNRFYGIIFGLNFDNKNRIRSTIGGAFNYYDGNHYGDAFLTQNSYQIDNGYRWYENQGEKADANLYAKINYQVAEKLNLYGDLQYRLINYSIDGIDNDLRDIGQEHVYNFFNPKIGAFIDLNDQHQAYLSLAVGNREPNRSALIDANPERPYPTAEQLYNAEAGYKFRSLLVSLSANLYYMYYLDQLVLTGRINDVGDPVMENVDRSYRTGIELSLGIRILKNLRWDINTTLSSNKIIGFTEYIDNWDQWPDQVTNELGHTDIAFSPSLTGSSIITWEPFKKLGLSLFSKYVGKQYIDNTSSNERKLDPYFINDLLISYSMNFKSLKQLGFSVKINNITNTKYESNAWVYRYYSEGTYGVYDGYFPQAGINFLAGIDLKF